LLKQNKTKTPEKVEGREGKEKLKQCCEKAVILQ